MDKTMRTILLSLTCCVFLSSGYLFAENHAHKILKAFGRESGLFVVVGCGDENAPKVAVALGENGNTLVHAIARDTEELTRFNTAIAAAEVKGCVTAEQLELTALPYRDYLVNVMIIMDLPEAEMAGLTLKGARRCLAPHGRLVTCKKGKVDRVEEIPLPAEMDTWTHRYYAADGIPMSRDKVFDLPVGFRWNCGLPMNFDNPRRSANRYSATRALVVDDGRCFTFSSAVYENLGDGYKSEYGTDQYLTCRDAFNGRLLWRKKIGDTYYGGLYIENLAPLVSVGTRLYLAGDNGKMLVVSTKTGDTIRELPTTHIPGVIAASGGKVVAATWKDGKVMGSIARYDRRRMDWEIGEGTVEAYDEKSGRRLWKNNLLATSMIIAEGRVYVVSRAEKDPVEKNHNRGNNQLKRPAQKVIAMDLVKGDILWEATDASFGGTGRTMTLEAAGHGTVLVAHGNRNNVAMLSKETGKLLDPQAAEKAGKKFFRYRGHICTPVMRVNDVILDNRGGRLVKPGMQVNFGGARGACLTGTVPAYGSGYIAQNWCCCSPGQIPGFLAIGPIGKVPAPAAMEAAIEPFGSSRYREKDDVASGSSWTSFRGGAERSSSAVCDIKENIALAWSQKVVTSNSKKGTLKREWLDYLNTRLTAPVISGGLAIVGDMDHNEVVAVDLGYGRVVWRFMTGGRMDTAPTLYKGMCLVGDHTGTVTAIKIKNGELLYRLRVAPEEKRMLSYGKVESVWPVIGGVMVAGGKAYVSAGRTQGSDGGIVVRAFVPETGTQVWARAIPQSGNGVIERRPTRNDTLVRQGDVALLMGHRIDLETGEIVPDPVVAFKAKAQKEAEKELGRGLNGKEKNALFKKLAPDLKTLNSRKISLGLEGLYSWNWTRVGHRKFREISYGGLRGDTISFSAKHIAACDRSNNLAFVYTGPAGGEAAPPPDKVKQSFRVNPSRQVTSLVVTGNVVVVGGAILDKEKEKGFIQAIRLKDATPVWDMTFASKLCFNGLAIDGGQIIASFDDGSVACLR